MSEKGKPGSRRKAGRNRVRYYRDYERRSSKGQMFRKNKLQGRNAWQKFVMEDSEELFERNSPRR